MHSPLRVLIAWAVGNPVAADLLMILVIILGILQLGSLRKETFPSMEPDTLTISTPMTSVPPARPKRGW